jgi:hypothetical protein
MTDGPRSNWATTSGQDENTIKMPAPCHNSTATARSVAHMTQFLRSSMLTKIQLDLCCRCALESFRTVTKQDSSTSSLQSKQERSVIRTWTQRCIRTRGPPFLKHRKIWSQRASLRLAEAEGSELDTQQAQERAAESGHRVTFAIQPYNIL